MSPKESSDEGIQLIDVAGGQGLEEVTATVSFAGEEVELKYRLKGLYLGPRGPEGSLRNKEEDDGNRERRGLPKGDWKRYQKLSAENKNQLKQHIGQVMKTYPSLSLEEFGNMICGAMIRVGDERPLDSSK